MRESLGRLDDALFDHGFQPFMDWLGGFADIDSAAAARRCIDASALVWIFSEASGMVGPAPAAAKAAQFALMVVGLGAIMVLRGMFRASGLRTGRANPLRPAMYLHRLWCLIWVAGLALQTALAPGGLVGLALLGGAVSITCGLYLGACSNPPPPRRHRAANWLVCPAPAG